MTATLPSSTLAGLETRRQDVTALWGRRAFVLLLVVLLVAALAGLLGLRTSRAEATEDGWSVALDYPSVARAGLDVTFRARIGHDGGFGEVVTLALTADYLDIYEEQGFHPEPAASRRDGDTLYLTFDAPADGETFVVSYDAYVQPAAQRGRVATLAVLTEGRAVAPVRFRTRLLP